ncbi:MAG: lysine--tRNA ligase [Candidatus Cloacimonas sp. SDB]|nr:MAG: lysine--tRNA ligase [Candidatus Cloacimonas sp. SDB]
MENLSDLLLIRRQKLQKIIDLGINPFPNRVKRTHTITDLIEHKEDYLKKAEKVIITGRLIAMRRQGKIGFANLMDESGKIQLYVRKDELGEENYELFKLLDLGDFLQVAGSCFLTQRGEYSVKAENIKILGKNLRPVPTVKEKIVAGEKQRYDEFADIELRYRKRYLDLLLNPQIKQNFVLRAQIIREIRNFLDKRGFLEVDTPILQPLYGGAFAKPFVTHHNSLNIDLYLRIAIELYLKRLIVGGFEKVYEIGKTFRNEGMDRNHNPEFTLLELYEAYADYNDIMDLTENLIRSTAEKVLNKKVINFQGQEINFNDPWRRASMLDLIEQETGFDVSDFDFERIKTFCDKKGIEIEPSATTGKLIEAIFEHFVEKKLIQPTFVTDFPKDISPLAKANPDNPQLAERFELFINGDEFANAFTELNDPIDQRQRLEAQAKLRELGDVEASVVDEDFLESLEYGMPPTGGLGIGIDRLIMLFTDNTSIKEVILFPQMKPEK